MAYANFISTDYLYKYTILDSNIDPSLLEPFIRQAQDLHLQTITGNKLYVKLINDVIAGTLTGHYKVLMDDYIQMCVANWTIYEALPFINYKLTNKAISEKSSDNSQPTGLSTVKYLRDITRDRAEFYCQRIREYILNNEEFLPEYTIYDQIGSIKPKTSVYFGGVYLRGNSCDGRLPGSGLPLN